MIHKFDPKKCDGCKNIKERNFPFGLQEESGDYFIDMEGCGKYIDGKEMSVLLIIHCPVCGAIIPCGTCGGTGEISVPAPCPSCTKKSDD